jgi:tetratricopeptide (TPR) repeat protein
VTKQASGLCAWKIRVRPFVLISLIAILAAPARPQAARLDPYGQLDGNLTLFTVMAALNAAGYDTALDSPSNHPLRKAVRDYLAQQEIPSIAALKRFVAAHRPGTPAQELSQYVTWALLSKGPPEFTPARADFPQPPEAAALSDLAPLMARFYKEADIESLWRRVQPYYDEALAMYTEPVSEAVLQVNAFLRTPSGGPRGRRFHVFLELLAEPNQALTRAFLDDYIVVVTPSPILRLDEIRHHYIHYMADYYTLRVGEELERIRTLADYALASPILDPALRDRYTDLAAECFIKAVEARVQRKPALMEQALAEGFVLTGAFYDGFSGYLAQEQPLLQYMPELVKAIDIRKEAARLDQVKFVSARAERTVQVTREVKPPAPTGAARTLEEGEDAIRARDAAKAQQIFTRALTETQEKALQARAYYGLARAAILNRDPEAGDQLFRRVLEMEPDAATRSWSLVYLGKLADSQGDAAAATEFYRQALAVPDLPDQVRREAEQGMQGAFTRHPGPPEPDR